MPERMQARRIPGAGQIAIREYVGFWTGWKVVDDPFSGDRTYRDVADRLPEPAFGPPLPYYPHGDPPETPTAVHIVVGAREIDHIAQRGKRAVFVPAVRDRYVEGDVVELVVESDPDPAQRPRVLVRVTDVQLLEIGAILSIDVLAGSYPRMASLRYGGPDGDL